MTLLDTVPDQVVVQATAATLSFQGIDSDGEPADPGTVTVTVSSSDGTAIVTAQSTSGTSTSPRTYALTASQTATVDRLTAVWTASGVTVGTTIIDVVGRALISKADFVAREPKRSTVASADFVQARREVDDLIRQRCHRSFVPRVSVERIWSNGGSSLALSYPDLRDVLWAEDEDGTAVTITTVTHDAAGIAHLIDATWPVGWVTIAYEHGKDRPPDDIVGAAAKLIAARLVDGNSSIPSRATSISNDLGTTSFVPIAGYGRAVTAIPEVDEALNAHAWNVPSVA